MAAHLACSMRSAGSSSKHHALCLSDYPSAHEGCTRACNASALRGDQHSAATSTLQRPAHCGDQHTATLGCVLRVPWTCLGPHLTMLQAEPLQLHGVVRSVTEQPGAQLRVHVVTRSVTKQPHA